MPAQLPDDLLDDLLRALVAEVTAPETVAISLAGSLARGDATPYSDVDLIHYQREMPATTEGAYTLLWRGGRLVSLTGTTIAAKRVELTRPETAIFAMPGLRQARILHDPEGALAELRAAARGFDWAPLQPAANAYASETVMGDAEEVHKILGALSRRDESATLYATLGISLGLTRAVAVRRGLLIESENAYLRRVEDSIGPDTPWTRYHRLALGLDLGPTRLTPATARGIAALHLYRETVYLLLPVLLPRHLPVIDATLEAIAASGLALAP